MKFSFDLESKKQRFDAWWNGDLHEMPLIYITAPKESDKPARAANPPASDADRYTDVDAICARFANYCDRTEFLADSFPFISLNLGAGSMALYLGSEPHFAKDTVWFNECVENWEDFPLKYNENNKWWKLHKQLVRRACELSGGQYMVSMPDIVENIDIISAMRGPQNTCYDIVDNPELILKRVREVDGLYFKYFDAFYDMIKADDGGNAYTAFNVLGRGRTAKIQCDFSALISPEHFREFVKPSLELQCDRLDNAIYHLDGKDAIKHIPALMEIKRLNALQWTPGAGFPDGVNERWYNVYDQVYAAGKSLWVSVFDGDTDTKIANMKKFVKRYGIKGTYFLISNNDRASADMILKEAAKGFK